MIDFNGTSRDQQPPHVRKSFANLTHDAIELGELQIKLLKLDTCEAGRNLRTTAILAAIGLVLLLGCLPVVLIAIAEAIVEFSDWSPWEAFSITAGGALLVCFLLAAIAWWKLKRGLTGWQRSSEELSRNVAWLKSTLKGSPPSPVSRPEQPTSRPV